MLFIGAGVLLILLGVYAMRRPNLLMPAKRETLQIAGQNVVMETRRVVTIPRPLSGLGHCQRWRPDSARHSKAAKVPSTKQIQ